MGNLDYAPLIKAVADAMMVIDHDGLIRSANTGASHLFRCQENELLGLQIEDLIPARLRNGHQSLQGELKTPGCRRDGCQFPAEVSLPPILDGRMLVSVADITERRHTSDALRKFSRVVEQTASSIIITDRQGIIEYVNPSFVKNTGYSAQEVTGRRANFLQSGHTTQGEYQRLWQTINDGQVWQGQFHNRRKDGSLFWESAIISPIRDDEGTITHFAAIKDDITASIHDRDAMAQSEQRFRATFDQAAMGMAHVGLDGRWLRVNQKLCDMVGYSLDELLQRSFQSITHPADLEADQAQMNALLSGDIENSSMDKRYIRKDGQAIWIRLTRSLMKKECGEAQYFIAVIQDIDDSKRAESTLLRLRGEVEQALSLHVSTQTAAAIAHDLNQPLNAVALHTEAALRMIQSGISDPDRLRHALQSTARQAQRAGAIMRELMQFLYKGEQPSEEFDVNTLVQEAVASVQARSDEPLLVEMVLGRGLRPVLASRIHVERVLLNLLSNALEAMQSIGAEPQSLTITVETTQTNDMAMVTVQDRGPGLDAEAAHKAFEPFFTTKESGLGMGLAVSRALIQAHGGQLWYESMQGCGATFRFTLPLA